MDFFRIALLALLSLAGIVVVRQLKPEFAMPLTIGISVMLLLMICDQLYDVVYTFYDFADRANIDSEAISCVVKVVGIGYLAEFSNNVCVDADCKSVGAKVLLASKIAILFCALPVVEKLFSTIINLAL